MRKPIRKGRLSNKKSDHRFVSTDGQQWDSKFECDVYEQLLARAERSGWTVRRTVKGSSDTVAYDCPKPGARCVECGSTAVVQRRTYTPDVCVSKEGSSYWVEIKGYFTGPKRSALRNFRKSHPGIDLRMVLYSDHKVGKGRVKAYVEKYLKIPVVLFKEGIPDEWFDRQA